MVLRRKKGSPVSGPYVKMWHKMEKRLDKAFKKLKNDVAKSKNIKVIQKDKNDLLLLLGECNYLSRECSQLGKLERKTLKMKKKGSKRVKPKLKKRKAKRRKK